MVPRKEYQRERLMVSHWVSQRAYYWVRLKAHQRVPRKENHLAHWWVSKWGKEKAKEKEAWLGWPTGCCQSWLG